MECEHTHGALQRPSGRRSLIHLKKVSSARPTSATTSQPLKGRRGKHSTKVLPTVRKSAAPIGVVGKSGSSEALPKLRVRVSERSLRHYRNTPSEKYRVKVHRLSFGLDEKITTPNWGQVLTTLTIGPSESAGPSKGVGKDDSASEGAGPSESTGKGGSKSRQEPSSKSGCKNKGASKSGKGRDVRDFGCKSKGKKGKTKQAPRGL